MNGFLPRLPSVAIIVAALLLASCGGGRTGSANHTATAQAVNQTDSLIGTWRLNGAVPKPSVMPQMYKLAFTDGGHVKITYVPGYTIYGPLAMNAAQVQRLTKLQSLSTTYDDLGKGTIRITWGSSATNFKTDIRNGKLFLTPSEAESGDAKADAEIAAAEPTMVFVRTSQ